MHVYVCVCPCVRAYMCVGMRVYVCVYRMYVRVVLVIADRVCVYCMYVCMYVCVCMCLHIYDTINIYKRHPPSF